MSFKTIHRIFLCFIAFVFFLIVFSGLTGCVRYEAPVSTPEGVPMVRSKLIAKTEGCDIYEVDTSSLSANHLYLTKCDFDKTSTVDTLNSKQYVTNVTVPLK